MPSWLPVGIFALACPVGMGLMMWFMMRRQHEGAMGTHEDAMSPEEKLVRLEAEKQALEQQIAAARNSGEVGKRAALRPQDK